MIWRCFGVVGLSSAAMGLSNAIAAPHVKFGQMWGGRFRIWSCAPDVPGEGLGVVRLDVVDGGWSEQTATTICKELASGVLGLL